MRYLNNRVPKRERELIVNPEGAFLFKENADRNLFSVASAFKLEKSTYWTAEDKLKILEGAIDQEKDIRYKAGLAKFLSEFLGIRLSPVVLLARTSFNAFTGYDKGFIASSVKSVMDRPDKIANAIAYAQYSKGDGKSLPAYFKRALKSAFEIFDAYTLKKFKLKRKTVKTADVIKILHPRPRNIAMSRLYKAIIENSNESAVEKDTVITAVLSDTKKTEREKKAWVSVNLAKIPLNALLRDLSNVEDTFENLEILEHRLLQAVRTLNGFPVVKIFNPFDLLGMIDKVSLPKKNIIFKVLNEFIKNLDLGVEGKRISFLVDISGSMVGVGLDVAKKYMSILLPMLSKRNTIFLHSFNTKFYNVIFLDQNYSVSSVYEKFHTAFRAAGGTALVDSIKKTLEIDYPDLLIVISDEITWADQDVNLVLDTGVPTIAINPSPYSSGTVFDPEKPIVKLSSIDAKILYYIPALVSFRKFKEWIKSLV